MILYEEMDYRIAEFYEHMLVRGCDWYKGSPTDDWVVYIKIKYGTSKKAKWQRFWYNLWYGPLFNNEHLKL